MLARMTVAPGVSELIEAAIGGARDTGFEALLSDGDLAQMAAQKNFLLERDFEVGQVDCYPALRTEEDKTRALKLFFEQKVEGWWNYQSDLIRRGICTQEEFTAAMG